MTTDSRARTLAICIASLSLVTAGARADDASAPALAASASKANPAVIYLKGSCAPAYPDFARAVRATGVTQVRFTIELTGEISGAEVLKSPGPRPVHKRLDQMALDALPKCPVRIGHDDNGQPVSAQIVATYNWDFR